jgi:hypothetical protein
MIAQYSQDKKVQDDYGLRAVNLLQRIPTNEVAFRDSAVSEGDLDSLKSRPDFQQWLNGGPP